MTNEIGAVGKLVRELDHVTLYCAGCLRGAADSGVWMRTRC